MSGIPTVQVLLDDGTGAYPFDVSSLTSLSAGITVSGVGRGDEFSTPGASTLTLTLDNNDGAFTTGTANLQVNGSFESAFTTGGQIGTATRWSFDTVTHLSGARSVKVAPLGGDTGNLGFQADRVAASPGVACVGSIYAKRAAGAGTIRVDIQFLNAALASLGSASTVTDLTTTNAPIGSWVRALSTGTAPALTAWVRIRVFYTSYVGGTDVANFDLAQLEVGTVPSFFVQPGTGIRYIETIGATTSNRFTGQIISLGQGWPGGIDTWSTLQLQATDDLARLGGRPMKSMLEEEILLDDPTAYYTLAESEGSTSAGDISGNHAPVLTSAGTGAPVTFGTGTGPTDGLTAVQMTGGRYLSDGGTATVTTPTTFSMGCSFSSVGNGVTLTGSLLQGQGDLGWELSLDGSGQIRVLVPGAGAGLITGPVVTDGRVHSAIVTGDGTTATLYADGVSVGTRAIGAPNTAQQQLNVGRTFTGTISHVATWPGRLTAAEVTAINDAGTGATESTDARLSRLASYAGMTATTVTPSGQLMGAQATSGQSLFDAMQAVAQAEGGTLYVDGGGVLTLLGRYHTTLQTTPVVTVDGDQVDPGTVFTYDTQQLINQVTVTRTGGATQVVSAPAVLADRNEPVYPQSLDLAVDTDVEALGHAQWIVAKYDQTTPRLGSATLDLLTAPTSVAEDLLGLNLGDHIALTDLPAQLWANAGDVVVQGWTENLQVSGSGAAWTIAQNLTPWALAQAWVLGDPVYGVLDSTTVLGY